MIVKYVQNNKSVFLSRSSIYIKNYIEILYLYNIYKYICTVMDCRVFLKIKI